MTNKTKTLTKDEKIKKRKKNIISLLKNYDFQDADNEFKELISKKNFKNKEIADSTDYEKEKAKYIKEYFTEKLKVKIPPDLEQAEAIGALGKNILVSARAGSGKTQTIAGKVAFLVEKYEVKPEEILVLCFNSSAAESMKKRIQKLVPKFKNARTFHSWAMSILFQKDDNEKESQQTENSILVDEKGEVTKDNLSNFLEKIIEKTEFKKEFYEFLREDFGDGEYEKNVKEIEEKNKKRYEKLKNRNKEIYSKKEQKFYLALNGTKVRSNGEKWILDFLLENGFIFPPNKKDDPIKWKSDKESEFGFVSYEKSFNYAPINNDNWKPDFTIVQGDKVVILEHWATDNGRELFKNYNKIKVKKQKQVKNSKLGKGKFENYFFMETEFGDMRKVDFNRAKFENFLIKKFRNFGFVLPNNKKKKEIKEKLIQKVWKREKKNGFKDFLSFINYIQQKNWDNWEKRINEDIYKQTGRAQKFIKLASKIAKLYFEERDKQGLYDFNKILKNCGDKILEETVLNKIKKGGEKFPTEEDYYELYKDVKDKNHKETVLGVINIVKKIYIDVPSKSILNLFATPKKSVKKFKWILIDEFQDFSPLFQNLIDSIYEVQNDGFLGTGLFAKGINIFCVGDPWQLINGFAGSDISLFEDFENNNNTNNKTISTCYRSYKNIVDNGNKFAEKHEFVGAESNVSEKKDLILQKEKIVKLIGFRHHKEYLSRFKIAKDGGDSDFWIAKQIEECFKIIERNSNKSIKSILLLSRNTSIGSLYIDTNRIKKIFKKYFEKNIKNIHKKSPQKKSEALFREGLSETLKQVREEDIDKDILNKLCADLRKKIKKNNKLEEFLKKVDKFKMETPQKIFLDKLYEVLKDEDNNLNLEKIEKLGDFKNDKSHITITTMHKSKGLEADIVILLDVCETVIPAIHPSNEFFEIFGRTPDKILDEEKRLFYVAITRAREKLFILTEEGKESEFLDYCKNR